jgi:uncharacterized protein
MNCYIRLLAFIGTGCFGVAHSQMSDAFRAQTDPVRADQRLTQAPPASLETFSIQSNGDRINGFLYLAAGEELHPIVIFLHGLAGYERNADLAQVVRRAGYDAIMIDYRGNWGSGGTFSHGNGLQDALALLAWVRMPETIAKYRLDASRIAIVGHSYGGWVALFTASHEPPTTCIAALAAWNAGWLGNAFRTDPKLRADYLDDFHDSTDTHGGPVNARSDDLMNELSTHAADWDYVSQVPSLRNRSVLLVGGTLDYPESGAQRHKDLADAIHAAGGNSVTLVIYKDVHEFDSHRIALGDALMRWLSTDCAKTQMKSKS